MVDEKKYLFISGCDRSGTTAVVRLLNIHPDICLGMERYKGLINSKDKLKTLNVSRFEKKNFFNIKDEETNIQWDYFYSALDKKYISSRYVGDKVPRYFQVYDHLNLEFKMAKHIFLVRDPVEVASSWKVRAADSKDVNWISSNDVSRSIEVWNSSLKIAYKKMKSGDLNIMFVSYSDLFSGNELTLASILDFLGLPASKIISLKFKEITSSWSERAGKDTALTELEVEFVHRNANTDLAKHALKFSRACN